MLIAKYERRFARFDDEIIAMYARGTTIRAIQSFLKEMYGIEASPDFISAVIDEVREWHRRPLEAMYPVVFFDTLRAKVRRRHDQERGDLPSAGRSPRRHARRARALDRADRRPSSGCAL